MKDNIPPQPPQSYRIILDLSRAEKRLDSALLLAIRDIKDNLDLKNISRTAYKTLFNEGKIQIKGQKARPSSGVAKGLTYIDILK